MEVFVTTLLELRVQLQTKELIFVVELVTFRQEQFDLSELLQLTATTPVLLLVSGHRPEQLHAR